MLETDPSVQAYIEKRSSEELLGFLITCLWRNQWHKYLYALPHIFATLQNRNIPIPEQIQAAWNHFLSAMESDDE